MTNMYTDTRVRTLLRKGVIIFKTTLANNNYPFGVNRFWGKCDELLVRKKDELLVNTPYQLLFTLWSYFMVLFLSISCLSVKVCWFSEFRSISLSIKFFMTIEAISKLRKYLVQRLNSIKEIQNIRR